MSRSTQNIQKGRSPLKFTRHPLVPEFDRDGLCLLESRHAVDFRMGWTRHPFLKIITALRGKGAVETKSGAGAISHEISPGKVLAVFPNTLHRLLDEPGEPLLVYILCIGSAFPFAEGIPADRDIRPVEDPAQAGRALHTLREIASLTANDGTGKTGNGLLRCGLTATLLARLLQGSSDNGSPHAPPDSSTRMRGFISRIREDFFLARSIDQAATELRMSRRRFTQLFARFSGESYLQHIHRLRMEYACRLLKETKLSPLTVAFQAGYEDASSFYRAFKKHTGMSPVRWRTEEPGGRDP